MATGYDIVTGALRLIGVKASESTITAAEAQDGLQSLNDMGEELEQAYTPFGFSALSMLSDEVNIPRFAVGAYKAILAVRIAPEYGKEISATLLGLVASSRQAMHNGAVDIGNVDYPPTLPRGRGNEDSQLLGDKFFPDNKTSNL